MKKIIITLVAIAFFFAFYEQTKPKPNVIITVIAVLIFMLGILKLMSKIPSKKPEDKNEIL